MTGSGETATPDQLAAFNNSFDKLAYPNEWQNILTQALLGTAFAVMAPACLVFTTNINFDFLGGFLLIALLMLIVMGLINSFFKVKNGIAGKGLCGGYYFYPLSSL